MEQRQKILYGELLDMQITGPEVSLSFEKRLARENGWSVAFAIEAISEYRKFLFLLLESGHPVTPSDQIDQVWHLHLLYTESYWNDLCERIAKRPLHHGPTAGGAAEGKKFGDWYENTKSSYRKFFDCEPPDEFWPPADQRFSSDLHFRRVNVSKSIIVPSPAYWLRQFVARLRFRIPAERNRAREQASGCPLLALLPCGFSWNPFHLNALGFLVFYLILIVIALAASLTARFLLRNRSPLDPKDLKSLEAELSVDDLAFLKQGPKGPVNAAIAELCFEKQIFVSDGPHRGKGLSRLGDPDPKAGSLLRQSILTSIGTDGHRQLIDIRRDCSWAVVKIAKKLKGQKLLESNFSYLKPRLVSILLMASVVAVGLFRIRNGINSGRPVGFLIALTFISGMLTVPMFLKPKRTIKGNQLLRHFKQKLKDSSPVNISGETASTADLGLWVAIFGISKVPIGMLGWQIKALFKNENSIAFNDGATWSGGCGGGGGGGGCGGGGGGCGGGCGGGGCGG